MSGSGDAKAHRRLHFPSEEDPSSPFRSPESPIKSTSAAACCLRSWGWSLKRRSANLYTTLVQWKDRVHWNVAASTTKGPRQPALFLIILLAVISAEILWQRTNTLLSTTSEGRSGNSFPKSTPLTVEELVVPRVNQKLGTIVILAPKRFSQSEWNGIDRFCFLLRAVRSIDQYINQQYGPYPIHILVSDDHHLDPTNVDDQYTAQDRALLQAWAPHTPLHFIRIKMYSDEALEPNTTRQQIEDWRNGRNGGVAGRNLGYQSMCRLWSGRVQQMEFLQDYAYYLRMDDDSLILETPERDPFVEMEKRGLVYAWIRNQVDHWGIEQLFEIAKPYLHITSQTPWVYRTSDFRTVSNAVEPDGPNTEKEEQDVDDWSYSGGQPYNNFHISSVAFWSTPKWKSFQQDLDREHAFFKYRVGDANVHAMAVMMLPLGTYAQFGAFPYGHNSNDLGSDWAKTSWKEECQASYKEWLPNRTRTSG